MELAERMKKYEYVARSYLTRRTPVIIRVDGKTFHTLTKDLHKPFDDNMLGSMEASALFLCKQIQGCKMAYIQSDEVSFLLSDLDNVDTEPWFDYNISKLISISASMMSVKFNEFMSIDNVCVPPAHFDSRAFNIPKAEVANYFLWRVFDWERNSLSMYCRSLFSHKELLNTNRQQKHEMLHKIEKNWSKDLTNQQKNGTFIMNTEEDGWKSYYNITPDWYIIQIWVEYFLNEQEI